jgi:hypothetical protein
MPKEVYYKIFDFRHRLMLVTPTQGTVNDFLKSCDLEEVRVSNLIVGYSRHLSNGWRVTKVLI